MNKVDYQSKCEDHLNNEEVYEKVQRNPTKSLKLKVNNTLK